MDTVRDRLDPGASPYIKTRDRIRSLIKERAERGVEVHIVYGKAELHKRERGWIDALPRVQLFFHKDLQRPLRSSIRPTSFTFKQQPGQNQI